MGEYYIAHHGIKGMKWGVRRWQNADGSYNAAGRARYGFSDDKTYSGVKSSGPGGKRSIGSSAKSLGSKAVGKVKSAGTTVGNKAKSLPHEAVAKIKEDKAKFATYVLGKNEVDTVIDKSVELSRIQTSKDFEGFAYYATYKQHDKNEYAGLFGKNLKSRGMAAAKASGDEEQIKAAKNMKVYQMGLKNTHNLKVPSDSNAGKVTANLLKKDSEFRSGMEKSLKDARVAMRRPGQQQLLSSAQRLMKKDPAKLSDNERRTLYKALNLTLTFHDENNVKVQDKFYGALKKKGYGALVDVNDKEYSSYHAKRPMIVFDTSGTKVSSTRELHDDEVNKLYKRYNTERIVKEAAHQAITALPNIFKTQGNDYARNHEREYSDYEYVSDEKKKQSGGSS